MSFFHSFTRRPVSAETQQSEIERLRGRQLASLVRAGGRAKNHQQTMFEVPITDTSRGYLSLKLTLPSDFPVQAPQVQSSLPVNHPWLDVNGTVNGHQELNNWSAHSDLGRIVSEIAAELRQLASTLNVATSTASPVDRSYPTHYATSSVYPATHYTIGQSYRHPTILPTQIPPPNQYAAPSLQRSQAPMLPSSFPELDNLTLEQLEEMNTEPNDDSNHPLSKFIEKHSSVRSYQQVRTNVLKGNVDIANQTMRKKPRFTELNTSVEELRATLYDVKSDLENLQERQQRILSKNRPDALLVQLKQATRAIDEESDTIAYQFANGEIGVNEFLSQYLEQRQLFHERTIKLTQIT